MTEVARRVSEKYGIRLELMDLIEKDIWYMVSYYLDNPEKTGDAINIPYICKFKLNKESLKKHRDRYSYFTQKKIDSLK